MGLAGITLPAGKSSTSANSQRRKAKNRHAPHRHPERVIPHDKSLLDLGLHPALLDVVKHSSDRLGPRLLVPRSARILSSCVCRKLDSAILMVEGAKDRS